MNVVLNGESRELPDGATVADVVRILEAPERGIAVAVDAEVVPRSQWTAQTIPDGAHVEVLMAVQGG